MKGQLFQCSDRDGEPLGLIYSEGTPPNLSTVLQECWEKFYTQEKAREDRDDNDEEFVERFCQWFNKEGFGVEIERVYVEDELTP